MDGWKRYYPLDVLPSLWIRIDSLIKNDRLIAPIEVKLELKRGGDALYDWACARGRMFREPTDIIQAQIQVIVDQFPDFIPNRSPDGIWADPYVIALAQVNSGIVVTGEKLVDRNARMPKIPNICQAMRVECINLLELIRREGWSF